jgi:phosphate transport system substrate-binding protein
MDKLTAEFLRFVLSRQGQEVVVKDGYFPLPNAISEEVKQSLK